MYAFLDVYTPKIIRAKAIDITSAADASRKRVESRIVDGRILPFRRYKTISIASTKSKPLTQSFALLLRRKLIWNTVANANASSNTPHKNPSYKELDDISPFTK